MGHCFLRRLLPSVFSLFLFFVFAVGTQADEIKGTISSTLTITRDSELVGNVSCEVAGNPCIVIGAPHVRLRLNGFSITGTLASSADCTSGTSSNDGIDVIGESDVAILGPGLVEKFGGFGIFLFQDSKVKVEGATLSDNCFSGVILVLTTDSDIARNVSVRNSMGSEDNPCGGT